MIIDSHAHIITPESFYGFRALLQTSNGLNNSMKPNLKEQEIIASAARTIELMDQVGTDMQLLSPRPFMLWHSHTNRKDVNKWVTAYNDFTAKTVNLHPTRFRGIAGLPQVGGQPVEIVFDEIDRTIDELGFIGVLLNPDPGEGDNKTPTMDNEYWYPLYQKLVEKDIPAHIHSASCYGRESYSDHFITEESLTITSIARSKVFKDFPGLKLMISHGGGAVPYQVGRWKARRAGINPTGKNGAQREIADKPVEETFIDTLRRFRFDTCLYERNSLELLFKVVGADRCLFGTERPGSGSAIDPDTGRELDDIRPTIEEISFLSADDKAAIFEKNALAFFSRLKVAQAAV